MRILGKASVYILVCLSLLALGISVWVVIEDYGEAGLMKQRLQEKGVAETQAEQRAKLFWSEKRAVIGEEIYKRQKALDFQRGALIELLGHINDGKRQMPWDPETGAAPASVFETKKQVDALGKENDDLFQKLNLQRIALTDVITNIRQERDKYTLATAEQKRLRLEIKPDDPNQKGFRDIIADHRKAKEDAELGQEGIKPDVMNELVRVAKVKARLDELTTRLKELQGAGTGGSARKR